MFVFQVWNLEDFSLVYQSPIITASPFLSLAMCQQHPHTAIGTADGLVSLIFGYVYQSPIVIASPFLSLAMCQQHIHTAIGTADGLVSLIFHFI